MADQHVAPTGDVIDHDVEGRDCVCGPRRVLVLRADRSIGWFVIHHSLDGRENYRARHTTDH